MKKSGLFCLALCILMPLITRAQSNYTLGYVIKNKADTLKGYINYRDWNKSPKSVEFKSKLADKQPTVFNASDVKGFHVNGYDDYLSYIGPVSTSKVNVIELGNSLDTTVRQDTVFLKVLISGANAQLLYQADAIKIRYFAMETDSVAKELNFYRYLNDDNRIITYAPFIHQLATLMEKYNHTYKNATQQISTNDYREDVLVKYIKLINNNVSKEVSGSSNVVFFIGAALSYNLTEFTGPDRFDYASSSSMIAPVLNFGVDFAGKSIIPKAFFRLEASMVRLTPTFNGPVANFSTKQLSITLTPQFVLNVYNTPKLKYFVDMGVGFAMNSFVDSKLVANKSGVIVTQYLVQNLGESYISLNAGQSINNPYILGSFNINLMLKTGVTINRKFEINLKAFPYAQSGGEVRYKNVGGALGFNYFLGSK